ncbi:zinc-binding alcohol dehydrogenase [Rhizobium sp. SSA_523]|uniref:zinc-dependent alcohol dehydrogenase n=1 Tax=Rhizobium sp. SSA_523 TaxID=2952477 RepID=UPI0020909BD1|nr:zinc-binding alcohol dehydrogenase [Rhizobium sp. SSA_523]MCO5732482.1 zinc-binding alcohol dehydrogenase [Rhizobium sp. SSA_523]WKC22377.1 zinc-binding alcohol dehydrogenase [Rhizobium sp. SSA_523]
MRSTALRPPGDGEVQVRTLYTGISRGTEATVFQGLVPESERERMRLPCMEGEFAFPLKYGYCAVGTVEAGEAELIGQTVFCLHPHQDRFVVPVSGIVPLPADLPAARGVLTANMETALNIVWDAAIQPGERVAVFGAGVVGTLVAFLARSIPGTEVVLVDPNLERASLASALDIAFTVPGSLDGSFDRLINASGSAAALAEAIELAGMEARLVEASWYGQRQVSLCLGGAFHSKRLSIVSSQVGQVSASMRARWDHRRRMAKAMDLLADRRLDQLISGESAFRDLPADYPRILQSSATLCHRISFQ